MTTEAPTFHCETTSQCPSKNGVCEEANQILADLQRVVDLNPDIIAKVVRDCPHITTEQFNSGMRRKCAIWYGNAEDSPLTK